MVLDNKAIAHILATSEEARMAVAEALEPFIRAEREKESGVGRANNAAAMLMELGIKTTNSGFTYLRYALEECLPDDPRHLYDIQVTKVYYPMIAKACNTRPANVEKAMRQAIRNAWEDARPESVREAQSKIFPLGRPKVKQLLSILKERMISEE